ncbi:hypothetical protein I2I05_03170 [Hymenobacter sp. BT683]|uniref:DUF1206 domain-containing protein n=1 Tax=Hymenobacter jeongseonensis TaxID=2791027 RepID=A0ABS0IDG4_9BACT|nr:hypothetical protein [Hymenobacter jeongseonensis]MBF9236387.1 hypothetical protein [Hymenobacter jeongseonensis]
MLNIPTTEERLGKSPQRLVRYFVLAMSLIYMGLGAWLWWSADQPTGESVVQLGRTARRVLGSVFILYGLIRFIRAYIVHFRKKNPSEDHE